MLPPYRAHAAIYRAHAARYRAHAARNRAHAARYRVHAARYRAHAALYRVKCEKKVGRFKLHLISCIISLFSPRFLAGWDHCDAIS